MAKASEIKKLCIANVLRRFTFSEWGGTETVVWNTAKQLFKSGHTPEVLSTKALDSTSNEIVEHIKIKRFNYFYPYLPLKADNKSALDKKGGNPISTSLFKYIKKRDYDILHSHTMGHLGNSVYLLSKLKRKPYVVSLHGGYSDVPKEEVKSIMSPVAKSFHYGKVLNAVLGRDRFMDKADGIICVGHNEYANLKEKYKDKNVIYLPNGVDLDAFEDYEADKSFKKENNIGDSTKVILCVSRVDHQKNQLLLVELMKINRDKDIHLVIVGPATSGEYLEKIKSKISEYSLEDKVTIVGSLKPYSNELLEIYKSSDFFILPSLHEPFGIVILEAWASNIPVIASKVGGIKKLLNDKKTGLFFESDSIESLNSQFKLLYNDSELQNALVKNADELVRKEYSWKTITEKLYDFYMKVIDNFNHKNNG